MDNLTPLLPEEKPSVKALVLSAAVHLLLIGALFLGVQWKSQAPSSVAVEVWRSAPSPGPVAKPEPAPEPPPPPPPPKAEPKPEPKPAPKVEPTPPAKPDIAIKDDKKKQKEEPKKPEPKKEEPKKPEPRKEEPKKPEPKKEEPKKPEPEHRPSFDDELKRELKQTQQQARSQQIAQDHRAGVDAELKQLGQARGEQAALARNRGLADYAAKIRGKIKGNIVLPSSIKGNPEAVFKVTQLPSGEIIEVKIGKSSGNKLLDDAIERAINKSSPLPLPDQPGLFSRELEVKYKPFDE